MQTRRLAYDEFKATFTAKMHDVTESATEVIDIWPYVEAVSNSDLKGHSIVDRFVDHVYRSDDEHFEHVLIVTGTKNVYLCVIVDLRNASIFGHHLLDLNREYGIA